MPPTVPTHLTLRTTPQRQTPSLLERQAFNDAQKHTRPNNTIISSIYISTLPNCLEPTVPSHLIQYHTPKRPLPFPFQIPIQSISSFQFNVLFTVSPKPYTIQTKDKRPPVAHFDKKKSCIYITGIAVIVQFAKQNKT